MKTYTTERGIKIRITPIPLLLDAIRTAHPRPGPPTYTENVAGQEVQVAMEPEDMAAAKEHNPDWYEEHREAWEAYLTEKRASDANLEEKMFDAVILEAVQVDVPEGDGWAKRLARFGVAVPDDEDERRLAYVKNVVIGGPKDILALTAIAGGADVSEEALAKAEASFRSYLQRNLTTELERQAGAVEGAEQPVSGDADGG